MALVYLLCLLVLILYFWRNPVRLGRDDGHARWAGLERRTCLRLDRRSTPAEMADPAALDLPQVQAEDLDRGAGPP